MTMEELKGKKRSVFKKVENLNLIYLPCVAGKYQPYIMFITLISVKYGNIAWQYLHANTNHPLI